MKFANSIETDASEVVLRERITDYLTKTGYRLTASQPSLKFERGSTLGSFSSLSPKGWKSSVVINLSPVSDKTWQAAIEFNVNASGQWVTDKERSFWQLEMDNLLTVISAGNADVEGITKITNSVVSQNLMAFSVIAGVGIIMAIIGFVIWGTRTASTYTGMFGIFVAVFVVQRWLNFKVGG